MDCPLFGSCHCNSPHSNYSITSFFFLPDAVNSAVLKKKKEDGEFSQSKATLILLCQWCTIT